MKLPDKDGATYFKKDGKVQRVILNTVARYCFWNGHTLGLTEWDLQGIRGKATGNFTPRIDLVLKCKTCNKEIGNVDSITGEINHEIKKL